jgi:hypothetical protein
MCISATVSLETFAISIISSIVLIYYGERRFTRENLVIGTFFIYVSFMQLLEFIMWSDIDGKKGWNQIATMITPIYVYIQPFVLYYIEVAVYGWGAQWKLVGCAAVLYLALTLLQYREFVKGGVLVTDKCGGETLHWKWIPHFNILLYFFVFIYAIFAFFPLSISLLFFIVGVICLSVSILKYQGSSSSFFCFISAFSPIAFLVFEPLI